MFYFLGQSLREFFAFVSSFILMTAVLTVPSLLVAIVVSDGVLLAAPLDPSNLVLLSKMALLFAVIASFFVSVFNGLSKTQQSIHDNGELNGAMPKKCIVNTQ